MKLPDSVANRIAAGEVIERPASMLKELLENAIDSKADNIEVSTQESGIKSMIVEDNGEGIKFEELPLAISHPATSKIHSIEDLDSINKEIKKIVKMSLNNNINNKLLIEIADIYDDQIDEKVKESIMKLFSKYMKTTYIKQLNENISIKILVKDRTLLSLVAEQGERYLFTKANSHIFDE